MIFLPQESSFLHSSHSLSFPSFRFFGNAIAAVFLVLSFHTSHPFPIFRHFHSAKAAFVPCKPVAVWKSVPLWICRTIIYCASWSFSLHDLFDSKILLLPFLAGSPACRSSGSLVAHLKGEKARMMRIAVKAPNPNIKGLKINSAMSCQFDSTKRRPMHQNCLACAQSATKKKPKRTES